MDSFSHSLLRSLAEALAHLQPGSGASVALCDAHDVLVERARAGTLRALAHLPSRHAGYEACDGVQSDFVSGWCVLSARLCRRDGGTLGVARVVMAEEATPSLVAAVQALATHAAIALEQNVLHQELQHSFNALFIVYEAGHLLNFSHSAGDVYTHVTSVLARTLHFSHCAVYVLRDDVLTPAAHLGLDPHWAASCLLPLQQTFAARVLDAGAAAQFEDVVNLPDVLLPVLDTGTPPGSILCAPLTTRAGTLGFLEVYRATAEPFSDDDLFVVSVLAVAMAGALENARLYDTLREREERLTQYAAKLVNSQEDERRRISRDIHDGLGQMIVSAFQYLQAHEYSLPSDHPRAAFGRGLTVLQECIAETRRVMSDLRPSTLDDFGLIVALQQQLDAVAQQAGWQAHFETQGVITRLAPAVETTIFRVVQEALNNMRKHAQTERAQVTLCGYEHEVVVEVRDWGRGFVVDDVTARPERGQRLGLMGMRERVALLGGTVAIASVPGAGTTVRIALPIA